MKSKAIILLIAVLCIASHGCGSSGSAPDEHQLVVYEDETDDSSGGSWRAVDLAADLKAYSLLVVGNTLYVGTTGAVFSTEGDESQFVEVGEGLPAGGIVERLFATTGYLYAGVYNGVAYDWYYKSDSEGQWNYISLSGFNFFYAAVVDDALYVNSLSSELRRIDGSTVTDIVLADTYGWISAGNGNALYLFDGDTDTIYEYQSGVVEHYLTIPAGVGPSTMVSFQQNAYIHLYGVAGQGCYMINEATGDLTEIVARNADDTADIDSAGGDLFVFGDNLYRSGGGSGGGAYYVLTEDRFIAASGYTPDGFLNPIAIVNGRVWGIAPAYGVSQLYVKDL